MNVRETVLGLLMVALFASSGACQAGGERERGGPASYCGVRCVARVIQGYGLEVAFSELVVPEYISNRRGSTGDDLVRALERYGLSASFKKNVPCYML